MAYRRIVVITFLFITGVSFLIAESNFSKEKEKEKEKEREREREDSIALIKELFTNKNRSEEEDEELSALIEESNSIPARESWEKYIVPIKYFLSPEMIQIYTDLANNDRW